MVRLVAEWNDNKSNRKLGGFRSYGIHIFYSLKISNKNILKNILEI